MRRKLALLLALSLAVGCTSTTAKHYPQEQRAKEREAAYARQPLDLFLGAEEAARAWERAQAWLARNSAAYNITPVSVVNDMLIQTSRPTDEVYTRSFGVVISREQVEEDVYRVSIRAVGSDASARSSGGRMPALQRLSYYMEHGSAP